LVIIGYIYLYLVQLRLNGNVPLNLAPVFELGASCAFLVFFFGEVSDKSKPVPSKRHGSATADSDWPVRRWRTGIGVWLRPQEIWIRDYD